MNLINEDLKLKILKGNPILLKNSNLFFIHRTINEIIDYGYSNFLSIIQLFCLSDNEIQKSTPIPGITTFFYFLLLLNNEENNSTILIKEGFNFFIGVENLVSDMQNKVLICSYKNIENIEINEESFKEIVEYIKIIYNGSFLQEEQDLSDAERRMKEKFDKARAAREAAKKSNDRINFSDMLGGFTVRNSNITFKEVLDLPYYTFFFLLKKLRKYDDYELQLKARLAGADIKEELHHWLSGDDEDE